MDTFSRTPTISDEVKQEMLAVATREGFDVSKFIWYSSPVVSSAEFQTNNPQYD